MIPAIILFVVMSTVTSSSTYFVMSSGGCPYVKGQESFHWDLFKGRWYSFEAFDVPYQFRLDCVTIDYVPQDKHKHPILITTTGYGSYELYSLPLWHTTVIHKGEAIFTNVSRPAELMSDLGQISSHFHSAKYTVLDTDYTTYSLVYACYEPTMYDFRIEAAWILTRKRGLRPKHLTYLKSSLQKYGVNTDNFKRTNNTHCCTG